MYAVYTSCVVTEDGVNGALLLFVCLFGFLPSAFVVFVVVFNVVLV